MTSFLNEFNFDCTTTSFFCLNEDGHSKSSRLSSHLRSPSFLEFLTLFFFITQRNFGLRHRLKPKIIYLKGVLHLSFISFFVLIFSSTLPFPSFDRFRCTGYLIPRTSRRMYFSLDNYKKKKKKTSHPFWSCICPHVRKVSWKR